MSVIYAQPDFTHRYTHHGITFYEDASQPKVCYFLPGKLTIGRNASGQPDMNFVMMRYAGSAVYNEAEGMRYRSIFSVRLVMEQPNSDSIRMAKMQLSKRKPGVAIRPLPIHTIDAMLVFTPVGEDSISVERGSLTAENDHGYNSTGTYWEERYFTLHLDSHSAMLLHHALESDETIISFMYAFYAKGNTTSHTLDVSGYGNLKSSLQEQLKLATEPGEPQTGLKECIVRSDAFEIEVDTTAYPDIIRQIDINDGVPPGYAVLNVRNYDFANNLRTDLYEKTVELEATGAGGKKVTSSVTFHAHSPEIATTNFRFRYAVRLDKPYRYRVRELFNDGREHVTNWTDIAIWSQLLDVTTRPAPNH